MSRMSLSALKLAPVALAVALAGCNPATQNTEQTQAPVAAEANINNNNPFFSDYDTPFGIAPFDKIKNEHYRPAFEKAIAENRAEIQAIVDNAEPASFENTIEALEKSGDLLNKVSSVFFTLTSAHTNDELQAIRKEVSPKLSALTDDINLNDALFQRVKAVYAQKDQLDLRADQALLLEDTYKGFERGGANLDEAGKTKLRELNKKLSELSIQFGENLLAETNAFELVIDNEADLAGLPEGIITAAAETAKQRGHEGKWVFTTHRPSKTPFLTYAQNRKLREKVFNGYTHRGDNDNANDNKAIASQMAALRVERAQLLGYKTHAHYVLESFTAKTPENVYGLLDKVWPAAIARAKQEVADMQALADSEGAGITIKPWDYAYYAEKIRKAKYDLDEEATKPYFSLENTLKGIFYTANQLWGITFKERDDIPAYHPEVRTFEVIDKDGSMIGLYLVDNFVRESKRGGAWMNSMRKQYRMNGEEVLPIIYNVTNFPAPSGGKPSLLTFDQASTFFHEFGHAIQGLLSDGYYRSQTGTALPRDYVEFPSQVFENWMLEPQVLANFATHYETGEVIPQELIDKIQAAGQFNQGFKTVEYLAASYLDMNWHTMTKPEIKDADAFEKEAMDKLGLIDEIVPRYRTTYFSHIFAGGYSSGYYGYIWSEVVAADAYQAFKENGIFDPATAEGYRKHVLETGGTGDPMSMYKDFRGKAPEIEPLLKSRGLLSKEISI